MFKKPLTVRSSVQVRSSEKKKLRERIAKAFPALSQEDLDDLIKAKSDVTTGKLGTESGAKVTTIAVDRVPLFFSLDDDPQRLFPTVYALWRVPHVVQILTVEPSILPKLATGVDVMLPGLVHLRQRPGELVTSQELGHLAKGQPCSIAGFSQQGGLVGPLLVGRALMSARDMIDSAFRGKGVQVLHAHLDSLWEQGPRTPPPDTVLSTEAFLQRLGIGEKEEESPETSPAKGPKDQASKAAEDESAEEGSGAESEDDPEEVLTQCFLLALKHRLTKAHLPVLVSRFWPEVVSLAKEQGMELEVKRTRHKTVGNFVKDMAERRYLSLKEESKGVQAITAVRWAAAAEDTFLELEETGKGDKDSEPRVEEALSLTAPLLPVFRAVDAKLSKGAILQPAQVKALVQEYVKKEGLPSANGSIQLDPVLSDVVGTRATEAKWVDLMNAVHAKLTKTYRIHFGDGRTREVKGAMPQIRVSTAKRSGNKMVTLVDNLSVFGIRPEDFAKRTQVGIAASASLADSLPPNEGPQVVIQGPQVAFVAKELESFYRVPRKFTHGLDDAAKKPKKGRRK